MLPGWKNWRWIALSSLAWAFCYPPFPFGPLAFIVLVPGMLATTRLNLKQAFWYHFSAGILYNCVMYWWIYNVMKVGPALVIGSGLVLLILALSAFNGLLGWLFRFLQKRKYGLIAYPILWAGLEVVRTRGEISFPWNNIGYALGNHVSLIQSVSYLGIFGLSLAIVCTNLLVFKALQNSSTTPFKHRIIYVTVAAMLPLFLAIQGSVSLASPNPKASDSLDISLVQPSIPQTKKWEETYFQEVMQKTWETMEGFGKPSPIIGTDLVVLAETAVPDFLRSRGDLYGKFQQAAQATGADFLVGALDAVPDPKPYHAYLFYNSAFLFSGQAKQDTVLQYSKMRLVPFSERLPFDDVFPIINYVNLGEGDFSAGNHYALWHRRIPYSPSICYEIIYPDFARGARKKGAELLVNITNDGWFGYSNAPFQHANIARFRSIEVGAAIARCSNAGISVFYDYKGRILSKTKLQEQTVLRQKIPILFRDTWYLKHGDQVEDFLFWVFILGLSASIAIAFSERKIKSKQTPQD